MKSDKLFIESIIELGKRVGLEWKSFDDALEYQKENGDQWYLTKEWTKEEEEDYRLWLENKLKKKYRFTKRGLDYEIGMFMLSYSWKSKNDE